MIRNIICPKRVNPVLKRNAGELANDHVERVYSLFLPLIKQVCEKTLFNGKKIDIPDYGEPDKYKAFFYHIFQYNQETKVFNYKRLIYCLMIPNLVLNLCGSCCEYCTVKNSKKKKRFTIFCKAHGYLIVLEERNGYYLLYTGYKPDINQIKNFE